MTGRCLPAARRKSPAHPLSPKDLFAPAGRDVRRVLCVCALTALLSVDLAAQSVGKISGTIKDAETGEVLVGCNVTLVGTGSGASTDLEGAYFILNIPPGRYDIQASMVGYQKVIQRGAIVNAGRTTIADFALTRSLVQEQEVIVQAVRPDVEKEKTSTSAIIRSEEVQNIAGIRDVGDILKLAADVTDGHFRGGRAGEEYYTLQGLGIVNPFDNSSAFLPIMSAVEEVEVITSGFSAQYGNAQSGVVNISMKEGRRDRWQTRVESRGRAPGRKHFGPSVYEPSANPYLAMLLNAGIWLRGDPNAENPQPYFGSMGSGLINRYARDTLVQLAVAQALYAQSRRDINRAYAKDLDFSVEASAGGPIDENLRMFLALRSNVTWPVFPTEKPDLERQLTGNLVFDLSSTASLRISGGVSQEVNNAFPGTSSASGFQRWLWDRVTGIRTQKRTNSQIGARFTHTLSPSTFYEIKLNTLLTSNRVGSTPVPSSIPDSVAHGGDIAWSFILPVPNNNSPDGIDYQAGYDEFRDERTRTFTLDASLTSQVSRSHLLNAGIQFNSYVIDVANVLQLRGNDLIDRYTAYPFEAAAYVQDKMEFEGMIANAGIRFDLWSPGRDSYTDLFTPYRLPDTLGLFHPESAPRAASPIIGRLQPRVGISFPVSVNTVFHINYGVFMQRPQFRYVVATRIGQATNRPVITGNARLEPEVTNSYDIGVTQGLGEGFTLDVSGYYKDVKNLLQQALFADVATGQQDSSYFNLDHADVRGFRLALSRRRGALTGSVNYQFSVATGKSANVTSAPPLFTRQRSGEVTTDLSNVPVRDITLDYDRTHNIIVNLAYTTDAEWGPTILDHHLFGDATLSTISVFRSGRPYTSPGNLKLINGSRSPWEHNTDVRLTKRIRNFFGASATVYVEVLNLFDNRILNYSYLFSRPTPTNPNLPLQYYEAYPVDDPNNGVRYWYNKGTQGPFAIDQSFLIYDNLPRSVTVGVSLEF